MKRIRKCPKCGSGNLLMNQRVPGNLTAYDVCRDCVACWESIPDGEHFMRDGELMPFREPCDNCAFRPGSDEIKDRAKWRELLASLKSGGQFFCHKGVPMTHVGERGGHNFDFPKVNGKEDPAQMRLCRGFMRVWTAWRLREIYERTASNSDGGRE